MNNASHKNAKISCNSTVNNNVIFCVRLRSPRPDPARSVKQRGFEFPANNLCFFFVCLFVAVAQKQYQGLNDLFRAYFREVGNEMLKSQWRDQFDLSIGQSSPDADFSFKMCFFLFMHATTRWRHFLFCFLFTTECFSHLMV